MVFSVEVEVSVDQKQCVKLLPRQRKDDVAGPHRLVLETFVLLLGNMSVPASWEKLGVSGTTLSP